MGIVDNIARRFGYAKASPQTVRLRGFKGGDADRLTSSWTLRDGSINAEIYRSLRVMRGRSRDLFANNEYAKQYGTLAKTNVIGAKGLTFRNRSRRSDNGEIDRDDNQMVEDWFRDFSRARNFTVTGKVSRKLAEQLIVETLVRDGEYLVHKVRGADNPHEFALQFIDVDRLDIEKNEARDPLTGNRVIMGVEVNEQLKPLAYWLLRAHPEGIVDGLDHGNKHMRIDASEMLHGFMPMRAEQVRGVPWLHAAMIALWDTGGWREAAIINARIGANKVGYVKGPTSGEYGPEGALVTGVDAIGQQLNDSEPGEWHALSEDMEIGQIDTAYPHAMFGDFNKAMMRGISAGMGVAYPSVSNDLEAVNYSTAKIGLMPEREMWTCIQEFLGEDFGDGYLGDWFRIQLLAGRFAPMPATPQSLAMNLQPRWSGRRWPSPEPLKDASANALSVGMRTKSLRRIMEADGIDPDEEWRVQAEDEAALRELGIPITLPTTVKVVDEAEA